MIQGEATLPYHRNICLAKTAASCRNCRTKQFTVASSRTGLVCESVKCEHVLSVWDDGTPSDSTGDSDYGVLTCRWWVCS